MDDCYQKSVCNCNRDCKCDEGFECCSQNYNGKKSTYGLCVKTGTCDKERGICNSKKKNIIASESIEAYKSFIKENYDSEDNCKEWKKGFWFLFIFFIIFLLILVANKFCKNK